MPYKTYICNSFLHVRLLTNPLLNEQILFQRAPLLRTACNKDATAPSFNETPQSFPPPEFVV